MAIRNRQFSGLYCVLRSTVIVLSVIAPAFSAAISADFDFDSHIGLAGMHLAEGACLAIPLANLPDGTPVTLVEPRTRRILDARVTGRLDGSCISGGEPSALIGDHGDSNYRLRIVAGSPRSYDVFITVPTAHTGHSVRDDFVRADLNGDGIEESFRACLSSEGLHLTVWSGLPLEGERRWHRYHYLGFELDPSAQDCTKADYEVEAASSRTGLQAYEPQMKVVEEGNRSFSYDMTLVDRQSAEKVADYFHVAFGSDEFPQVYSIPDRKGIYLVTAIKDHRGLTDFGRRFFLVLDEDDGLRTVYRGGGVGDSYILRPTFFAEGDAALILAEVGFEYSSGLEAYALAGKTLRYLGSLGVASWSGENYVNPLPTSKVSFGEDGYHVQFYSDLILDPGGIYQWTLPMLKESISFIEDDGRFVLDDDSVGNQACFFLIDDFPSESADSGEVSNDFVYYFDGMIAWLTRRRISYSFQRRLPLKMIATSHSEITIPGRELRTNLGVVLTTADGRRKILYGVHTDVDLASEMTAFFDLERIVQ